MMDLQFLAMGTRNKAFLKHIRSPRVSLQVEGEESGIETSRFLRHNLLKRETKTSLFPNW